MRVARAAVVLLLALSLAGLAEADTKLPPYTCFFGGECSAAKLSVSTAEELGACLKAAFPTSHDKQVVMPGSPAFSHASLMTQTRFPKSPAAVVYARQTSDVQAAVKCAYNNGVRVTVAGGRHSYMGYSVMSDYLTVDTSNMTEVKVTGKQGKIITAEVGPGNTNALLISQLKKQGYSSAGTIIGQCPSVGVSGYILGGGQGDLSRMFGLACDQVLALEMVTFTGEVVTANAQQNSDLLWAACGGGGGLGVITRWTVKAHDLGTEPFSQIKVAYNPSSAIQGVVRMQQFIMDDKTDLRFSGGGGNLDGYSLYFAGDLPTAMRLLKEGGMLDPAILDRQKPSTARQSRAHLNQTSLDLDPRSILHMPPTGVDAQTFANYYETIMEAECRWLAGDAGFASRYIEKAANWGFGPDKSCLDMSTLNKFKALAAQPGTVVTSGTHEVWLVYGFINTCRQLPPLNATVWQALLEVANDPRCATKGSVKVEELSQELRSDPKTAYYCLALKHLMGRPNWNHILGGAVARVPSNATAYPWRKAISPLCFDTGPPMEMLEADLVTFKKSFDWTPPGQRGTINVSPAAMAEGMKEVQAAYLKVLYRMLGEDTARQAYYNYQTDQTDDYEAANFGPNNKRLQEIKAKWDPEGLFSKPITVRPARTQ